MAGKRGQRWVSTSERLEIRRRVASGEAIGSIAGGLGRTERTIHNVIARSGSISPRMAGRSPLRLSVAEREEISRGLRGGESFRRMAAGLDRSPSTVSREVAANGGRRRYRAHLAEDRTAARARHPRRAKLARNGPLRGIVEHLLELHWSPQQIAWQLRQDHPDEPEMLVSHETIYQSLFVQGRGALRAELTRCLRTGRARRRPAGRARPSGELADMVLLSERPAGVDDRAVPGHWEGDLIIGKANRSAIGTLVERQTRYVMLVALPHGRTAEAVRAALAERILALPARAPAEPHLGPRQGDGRPRPLHRRDRRHRLLLRPPQSLAAGQQREHQRPRSAVLLRHPKPVQRPTFGWRGRRRSAVARKG